MYITRNTYTNTKTEGDLLTVVNFVCLTLSNLLIITAIIYILADIHDDDNYDGDGDYLQIVSSMVVNPLRVISRTF